MDDFELQRLGTNTEAQSILTQEITAAFPQLETERGLSDTVIEQFYDWSFPFLYGADGGGARKWRTAVQAVCRKNPKLQELEAFFEASGTDGTFKEVYSGQDEDDYTDNHATRTKTRFAGVGTTTSENLGDETETAPVNGQNTTTTIRKKGTTRTYADGRTWTQILRDVGLTVDPVFEFINSFAQTLLPPCEDPCEALPPSVAMTAQAEALEVGSAPTAEIVNRGTPVAADWLLKLGLPKGADGADGAAATVAVGTVTTGEAGTPAKVENVGTENAAVFNFTIPRGNTGASGKDGADGADGEAATVAVGTVTTGEAGTPAKVENVGTPNAAVLNFTIPQGEKGPAGPVSALYMHVLSVFIGGGKGLATFTIFSARQAAISAIGDLLDAINYTSQELLTIPSSGSVLYENSRYPVNQFSYDKSSFLASVTFFTGNSTSANQFSAAILGIDDVVYKCA